MNEHLEVAITEKLPRSSGEVIETVLFQVARIREKGLHSYINETEDGGAVVVSVDGTHHVEIGPDGNLRSPSAVL
ncbi:MAG: hypothetical protein ABL962_12800 [Fimbriimonadaceae bacterium]